MSGSVGRGSGGGLGLPSSAPEDEKKLCLTVPQAAKMLGISRNFGYELVRQRQLPVVKFGKRLLIPRAALQEMLVQRVEK